MTATTVLAIIGPLGWAWLTIRAQLRLREIRRLQQTTRRQYDECRKQLDIANAEMLLAGTFRSIRERQMVTCNAPVFKGTEAPV